MGSQHSSNGGKKSAESRQRPSRPKTGEKQGGRPVTGRPSVYREDYARMAYQHCLLGATDEQLADLFEVSKQTINTWKQKHPAFLDSIKRAKRTADSEVAQSLFKRATGFTHPAVKIFSHDGGAFEHEYQEYIPPDTGAAAFWLKNRQPELWRDKPEVSVVVNNEVQVDLTKPFEECGQAELEAELKRRGAFPDLHRNGTKGGS